MACNSDRHDLIDFMCQMTSGMSDEYERIWRQTVEDPGTAGDQGEENWAELLKNWLPKNYTVVTKGRLIGQDGTKTPQLDVIVLKPSYPPYLVNKKLYLAGGVAAVFECKNTLKTEHIQKAVENCIAVKSLFAQREGTLYDELFSPIVFGLLAHSHIWKGKRAKPRKNIENALMKNSKLLVNHPRLLIDSLCVADTTAFTSHINSVVNPAGFPESAIDEKFKKIISAIEPSVMSSFIEQGATAADVFKPVGIFITDLARRLAWEDFSGRSMSEYYEGAAIARNGIGECRDWKIKDVYSKVTIANFNKTESGKNDMWDKWSIFF